MAKNDFLVAITQLAAEKNLPKEVVFDAVEAALASAYKKDTLATSNVVVKIDPETGTTRVFTRITVVEEDEIEDPETEVNLEDGRKLKPGVQLGDGIDTEVEPQYSGRVAAQTAKQVVLQRLREAEREVVFDEYSNREGDIVSGEMVRMEGRNVIIDLGKAEALLPASEQVRIEHYRAGQPLKYYVLAVHKAAKGPQVIVARTHKNVPRPPFAPAAPAGRGTLAGWAGRCRLRQARLRCAGPAGAGTRWPSSPRPRSARRARCRSVAHSGRWKRPHRV